MKTKILPFALLILTCFQLGAAPASFWDDLLRAGTRSDDAIEAAGRAARVADDLVQQQGMGKVFTKGLDDIADPAARSRLAQQMIRETMYAPDANLLRRIDSLTPEELSSAMVFARGGRQIIDEVPDVAARSRLLRQGGSDLVAATGIHGPDLAREAARLDMMTSAGRISSRIGDQNTIARFAEVMRASDNGAWEFWTKYVTPHWQKWLAGGAVVTYLAKPELFHDAIGALTEFGTRELVKIIGAAALLTSP